MDGVPFKAMACTALAAALGTGVVVIAAAMIVVNQSAKNSTASYAPATPALPASCNVYNLSVDGEIVTTRSEIPSSEMIVPNDGTENILTPGYAVASDITYYLEDAAINDQIKAVLIDVNSTGGDPEGSEEIGEAMKAVGKPVVVVIHQEGDSGGYLLSTFADKIFASRVSDVGSIGITASFINQSQKDAKDGVTYEQLSSGPFKDLFSPDKPLTDADRALINRDLAIGKTIFVQYVSENRHLSTSTVNAIADGSTVMGDAALSERLIDAIGGDSEALDYLTKQIGTGAVSCF